MQDIRTVVTATYEPRWNVLAQIPQWTVINEFETEEQATEAALYLFDKFNVTTGVAQAERTYPSIEEMVVTLTTRETVETTEQDSEEEYVQAFEEGGMTETTTGPEEMPEQEQDTEHAFARVASEDVKTLTKWQEHQRFHAAQAYVDGEAVQQTRTEAQRVISIPEDFAKSTTGQALKKRGED